MYEHLQAAYNAIQASLPGNLTAIYTLNSGQKVDSVYPDIFRWEIRFVTHQSDFLSLSWLLVFPNLTNSSFA